MKKGPKKIIRKILNIVLWVIIIIAALVTVVSLSTKEKGVANIAGVIPFSIQSNSMADTMKKGDLIFTKKYDGENVLEVGDVISFFAYEEDTKIIKTHRIIEVKGTTASMVSYITKGDNNPGADEEAVAPGDIISVWNGKRIGTLGYILTFLKSKYGFLLCIILPLFIIFIFQLFKFVSVIMDEKKKQIIREVEAKKSSPNKE